MELLKSFTSSLVGIISGAIVTVLLFFGIFFTWIFLSVWMWFNSGEGINVNGGDAISQDDKSLFFFVVIPIISGILSVVISFLTRKKFPIFSLSFAIGSIITTVILIISAPTF